MAYYTGQANSFADLFSALKNACELEGWAVSGNIFHKDVCYVKIENLTTELRISGGTGTASNDLTGHANVYCRIRSMSARPLVWPVDYHVHITAQAVFLIINFSVSYYQWLAFGTANKVGNIGTGNWFGATVPVFSTEQAWTEPYNSGYSYSTGAAPFLNTGNFAYGNFRSSYIHVPLDGVEWLGSDAQSEPHMTRNLYPIWGLTPNAWNNESVLLPVYISHARPSSKSSIVAQIDDFRLVRITHYEPGQVIIIGHEKWKIYPFFAKNSNVPNGGAGHSGTLGWAIRYDGP